ncbi:MAG: hypothetical protein K6F31_08355 [Acetatifactor sp.]|nr:hypothetical protein [Acetatifactor sp.]
MRRFMAILSVISIVLALSITAKAANESVVIIRPGLSFSGTTATCTLKVFGEYTTDSIVASVTLKHGSSTVKQWTNLTANGYMDFSDTAPVSHGVTYTMQVTVSINGVPYSVADITKTCP